MTGSLAETTAPCPLASRHVVETLVVGMDDVPLHDIAVELRNESGMVVRGKTDREGVCVFAGLTVQPYQISLAELDREAWTPLGDERVPSERALADAGPAAWTPADDAPARSFEHTVAQGECVSKLSEQFGLSIDVIWSDPANSELAQRRGDPYVLAAGDRLTIPAKRRGTTAAVVGRRYRLRRLGVPETFRVRFLIGDVPRAKEPYLITIVAADGQPIPDRTGTTDDHGFLIEWVSPSAVRATVRLGTDSAAYEFALGHLDPIASSQGVIDRLRALGFLRDGANDASVSDAIRSFQSAAALEPTGAMDDATVAALDKAFRG